MGATDEELAEAFGKSVSTISAWKLKFPEFQAAIKRGKFEPDMTVVGALFRKATGYREKITKVIGKGDNQRVVEVDLVVEPDVTACIFWLKNRRKDQWRDRHEHNHGGKIETNLEEVRSTIQGKLARITAAGAAAKVPAKP